MEQSSAFKPPHGIFSTTQEVPLVHLATELYKKIYQISTNLPKKERLGIILRLENCVLAIIETGTEATFLTRTEKLPVLLALRRHTEVAKRLIRICDDLNIIKSSRYILLSSDLQQVSKMTNGWIKSLG